MIDERVSAKSPSSASKRRTRGKGEPLVLLLDADDGDLAETRSSIIFLFRVMCTCMAQKVEFKKCMYHGREEVTRNCQDSVQDFGIYILGRYRENEIFLSRVFKGFHARGLGRVHEIL